MDEEELTGSEKKEADRARADANNAQNIRNAAEVAVASGNGYGVAIGGAVKAVDSATGGKGSEIVGKALTRVNEVNPGGKLAQAGLNKLNESGVGDVAGKAASVYNQAQGAGDKGGETPNQVKKPGEGGESKSSLPSSADKENKNLPTNQKTGEGDVSKDTGASKADAGASKAPEAVDNSKDKKTGDDKETKGIFEINSGFRFFFILLAMTPLGFLILIIVFMFASVVGSVSGFEDAFGISSVDGTSTGGVVFYASSTEQQEFYERVLDVKNNYSAEGKTVDPLKIVAVYNVLKANGVNIGYEGMTTEVISDIADCMFLNNVYSDETFKNNLISYLIPKYLPNTLDEERVAIAQEVFEWVGTYNKMVGKTDSSSCSDVGSCTYTISGFYIKGKGNVKKDLNINDLYVRLMQCGSYNGHNAGGQWGMPLAGEELVPFEKYILGVAYQEIGPGAPEQAFKAQMIAARSYILARPTDMGGWRKLQQEADGKWVIQVASCTADQVYCDPDQGCSTVAGGNGQWYQVHSGTTSGRTLKGPIAQDSVLRQYAADVQGELVVNNQGYVVSTGYVDTETKKFTSLAKSGYDYKQILLQVYNQGSRNYGAYAIYKASCGNCVSSGEFANWKQYEGEWTGVQLGSSGKTIKQIGCLATSLAIQVAKSGVQTNISDFNPGTFVEYLSAKGAFSSSGALNSYASVSSVAPSFKYESYISLSGMSKQEKLNTISGIVNQNGVYAVAEVKGNTGQHWVAIDSVNGDTINMMDPGSSATDMWGKYNWVNTSRIVYYRVG